VNGFKQSNLYVNAASRVIFRPWQRVDNADTVPGTCTVIPMQINPPYNPYGN